MVLACSDIADDQIAFKLFSVMNQLQVVAQFGLYYSFKI